METRIKEMMQDLESGVTFVELIRNIGLAARGDRSILSLEVENILFWHGVSQEFADAFEWLHRDHLIEMEPTSLLVYVLDGEYLAVPLARRARSYKSPRWWPVSLRLGSRA